MHLIASLIRCAKTIDHLPHEFKLLWNNQSAALDMGDTGRAKLGIDTGRAKLGSDCNLPSACYRCRGKEGTLRPPTDLMAIVPCGFCRCANDEPPYVTLRR